MKQMFALSFVMACVSTSVMLSSCDRREAEPAGRPSSNSTEGAKSAGVSVGVDEFMKNVDANRSETIVEGVVSAISTDERRVALIDAAEFERCGVVTCAESALPVRWSGDLPAVKEHVRVRGKVEHEGGKLIFVAASAEKIRTGGPDR